MPGLLDGQIAQAIASGFKGKLLKGTLRRMIPSGDVDDDGDAIPTIPQSWRFEGFDEDYDDHFRLRSGIPEGDVRINIIAKSLPNGVRPRKDDKASIRRDGIVTWYQLRRAKIDPAGALWDCQAFEVPAPLESV